MAGWMAPVVTTRKPARRWRLFGMAVTAAAFGSAFLQCRDVRAADEAPGDAAGFATAIRERIRACWNGPAASGPSRVLIAFDLNRDGTLAGKPQVLHYPATPQGPALANAAVRAVRRCVTTDNPLKLPPDLYASWKQIEIAFDTR